MLTSLRLASIGVGHGFSTRVGGVSSPPFDSLNFGNPSELPPGIARDAPANIAENWRRALEAAGLPGRRVAQVHQVHGSDVLVLPRGAALPAADAPTPRADAIVTDDPAIAVAVRVADCAPVLLSSADGRVVAAVHAGWRGIVAGVLPRAAEATRALGARDLIAAIGPCIGPLRFEVGPEVVGEFRRVFGPAAPVQAHPDAPARAAGKAFIDLHAALRLQAEETGLHAPDVVPGCTASRPDLFFSHRRDAGVTGRMIAVIGPRGR